jgi:hypothetical protein
MSVRQSAWNNLAPTGGSFMKFGISVFFENLWKFQVLLKSDKITVLYMMTNIHFWSYLAYFFVEWEMYQTNVAKKTKTHVLCSITFFPRNRAVNEIMRKNILEPERPQMTIDDGSCALRAGLLRLQTHSECIISIAFSREQWLIERASMLCYTYTAFLVFT